MVQLERQTILSILIDNFTKATLVVADVDGLGIGPGWLDRAIKKIHGSVGEGVRGVFA